LLIPGWFLLDVSSAIFFGGWLALSLVGQILPRDSVVQRSPIGWLIPDWRFFAPAPAVEQRILVYRFKSAADDISPIEALHLPAAGRLRWLWNPQIRRHKALFDLTNGVHRVADSLMNEPAQRDLPDALLISEPYLVLLNLVSSRLRSPRPALVQFGIIHRTWPADEELVFLSRWHTLESSGEESVVARGPHRGGEGGEEPRNEAVQPHGNGDRDLQHRGTD
jgi:hypothetical protein